MRQITWFTILGLWLVISNNNLYKYVCFLCDRIFSFYCVNKNKSKLTWRLCLCVCGSVYTLTTTGAHLMFSLAGGEVRWDRECNVLCTICLEERQYNVTHLPPPHRVGKKTLKDWLLPQDSLLFYFSHFIIYKNNKVVNNDVPLTTMLHRYLAFVIVRISAVPLPSVPSWAQYIFVLTYWYYSLLISRGSCN